MLVSLLLSESTQLRYTSALFLLGYGDEICVTSNFWSLNVDHRRPHCRQLLHARNNVAIPHPNPSPPPISFQGVFHPPRPFQLSLHRFHRGHSILSNSNPSSRICSSRPKSIALYISIPRLSPCIPLHPGLEPSPLSTQNQI